MRTQGKSALNSLLRKGYNHTSRPKVQTLEEATGLLNSILPYQMFLPCLKEENSKELNIDASVTPVDFTEDCYYVWVYQGSELTTLLGGIAVVFVIFAGVLFPLWPHSLQVGVSYLSNAAMAFIAALLAISVVRLIVWFGSCIFCKQALWIFPNLYADVGFFDSFKPFMAWEEPKEKKEKKGLEDKKDQ
jgi:translocation protein SEC62